MKKIIFLFVATIFVTVSGLSQGKWTPHTSDSGKFTIATFGAVEETNNDADDKTTYKINFANGSMNYLVSSTDHHSDLEGMKDELLTISLNSFREAVDGKIISEKEIYLDDVKGKYAIIIFQEETIRLEYYTFINGTYQYQLVIYSDKTLYNQEEADLVNISFRVLD
ncbi:MAG: hypothetical protein COB12_06050 [Flavobacterium sp.]|nr:MAG: hypothetical protein COB12_06050 [Flavobacterium sp.]